MDRMRLKQARERARHTQESLAEASGLSSRMITRYESGDSDPSADVIARIALALEVSADYLLGLTDDPTPSNEKAGSLSASERSVLSAMRRGDKLDAIKAIVGED